MDGESIMHNTGKLPSIRSSSGFTVIEILLVAVIVGAILAVVIPRAWRANVDTKYSLLRQSCTELASWGNEWAQRQLESQDAVNDSADLNDYMETLTGGSVGAVEWVGRDGESNWNTNDPTDYVSVPSKISNGTYPTAKVLEILAQDKLPRNPFNGLSVFAAPNDGFGSVVPGAVGCAWRLSGTQRYYALIFLGTDSDTNSDFYAGQGTGLDGLRSGIFMAQLSISTSGAPRPTLVP